MKKFKKDIFTIILFIIPLILFSLSLKVGSNAAYWYTIKFEDNEIYSFRYTNIEIENYNSSNGNGSDNINNISLVAQEEYNKSKWLINSNRDVEETSNTTDTKYIAYGKAVKTQNVLLICITCVVVSVICNLIILLLQLINIRVKTKHNSFLMAIISKVIGFMMISFTLVSVLYLLSFRQYFDKECLDLGNCLIHQNNNNSSTSGGDITSGGHGLIVSNGEINFIGSNGSTYYKPGLGWILNVACLIVTIVGVSFLFVPKDKEKQKYSLLV